MRTLLALALFASLVPASGCFPFLSCGGYSGGGDIVYQRGTDTLILCDNGGFVATMTDSTLEGTYTQTATGDLGTDGATSQLDFTLALTDAEGVATIPELGDGTWTEASPNQVELDHYNLLCEDLANRSWWTAQ